MSISFHDISDSLRRISIFGRLDVPGTDAIASEFGNHVTSAPKHVIVDMTSVSFVGSIGVRALIVSAKEQQKRGRKLALVVGDNAIVMQTLATMGVNELIPIFGSESDAIQATQA